MGADPQLGPVVSVHAEAAERLSAIHDRAFPIGWSAAEIAGTLAVRGSFALLAGEQGMAMGRVILDEAEILTLAVLPESRRKGIGHALVEALLAECKKLGAEEVFLEVAISNVAAQQLYRNLGFSEIGRRSAYYRQESGQLEDAISMRRKLA